MSPTCIALFWIVLGPIPSHIEVTMAPSLSTRARAGRVIVVLTKSDAQEPRMQVTEGPKAPQVFGIDVEAFTAERKAVIDESVFGYPIASLRDVPAGDYFVQAVLHEYETFARADGHVLRLPMDRGEGQQWSKAPGNLYSTPRKVHVDPAREAAIEIVLDQVVPAIAPPADTRYVKHVRIKSELLSRFWGRDMHLGAVVLLPKGFDEHPEARYPLMLNHGHFEPTFGEFREALPDPDLEPDYSERFRLEGYNRIQQQQAHELFATWTSEGFPRFLVVKVQHANPFYDDSYAVNSANLGPYGDAIMKELIPYVEKTFRGIGSGWARFVYGGSTGGWEAMAAQVFYPDEFNGCFVACPDPIDFRAYCLVNIYEAVNAYYLEGDFLRLEVPSHRDYIGRVTSTVKQSNHLELVLGTHSRSGGQWDIWEAVFSPVGVDGYPRRIWDKTTGVIDRETAAYWRDRFDLRAILERDWVTLGPKLRGKIHIYCGTMDNLYLDNAVALTEEFLKRTRDPPYDGVVDYGLRAEHCWNGDHERPNAISRLRYHVMYVDQVLQRIDATAPEGADTTSWRY